METLQSQQKQVDFEEESNCGEATPRVSFSDCLFAYPQSQPQLGKDGIVFVAKLETKPRISQPEEKGEVDPGDWHMWR